MNDPTPPQALLDEAITSYYRLLEQGLPLDRAAFLARYPDLAADLAAFLATVRAVEDIARPTPAHDDTPPVATPPPEGGTPALLGEYELLGELGRGGMGVVYKARQRGLNRLVALKLILAGEFASKADVNRFYREAEAVAGLDHPRIVPIYEIGSHHGRHFFSMKFIDGATLASRRGDYLNQPRATATLVGEIALAVYHAHQHGILHRDLKPGNILLDSERNPHVVDFGLARPLGGGSDLTRSGAAVGTPSYMAPEQASGGGRQVSTAADVYGLGAILYELLTGVPPFRADSPYQTVQLLLQTEPAAPRRVNPQVPADLETICLKAMAKEPARRYASAAELAADLHRWLNDEAIQARPVGRIERAYLWCRRNPVQALLTGALAASVLAGVILVGVQWQRAEREAETARIERDVAQRERDTAARERVRAEAHLTRAQDAIDFIGHQVSSVLLANVPHADKVRREMIEYAIRFHEGFLAEAGSEPGVRRDTAMAYLRTGQMRARLGESAAAIDAFRRAITLFELLHGESPGDAVLGKALLESCYQLVVVLADTGKVSEAEQAFARCEKLFRQIGPAAYTASEREQTRAALLEGRLRGLRDAGKFADAEGAGKEAHAIYEKLLLRSPGDRYLLGRIARLQGLRGWNLKEAKRNKEARAAYESSLAHFVSLLGETPLDPGLWAEFATARRNCAIFLRGIGDQTAARAEYRAAQKMLARLVDDFPDVPYHRSEWAESLFGEALLTITPLAERRRLFAQAVIQQRQAVSLAKGRVDLRRRFVKVLITAAQVELDADDTDHAKVVSLLAELRPLADSGMDFWVAGKLLITCVLLADLDANLPPDAKKTAVEKYTTEFVALVQRSRDLKHKEWVTLVDDPSFREMPPHPALTRLLEERKAITPP